MQHQAFFSTMSKAEQMIIDVIKRHSINISRLASSLHVERFRLKRAIDEYLETFGGVIDESELMATRIIAQRHKDKRRKMDQKDQKEKDDKKKKKAKTVKKGMK